MYHTLTSILKVCLTVLFVLHPAPYARPEWIPRTSSRGVATRPRDYQLSRGVLPTLEQAQYWTGRRLWHAQRRLREGTRQQLWELQQTLRAAEGLNNAVCEVGRAVAQAIRTGDSLFEYQSRAQRGGFAVDRGTGVNLIYDPLGEDASTQTPYLWPEGLGGYPVLEPVSQPASSSTDPLTPVSRLLISGNSSSADESVARDLEAHIRDFWDHDGSRLSSPR